MNYLIIDKIIKNALTEDISGEDITTNSIVPPRTIAAVNLIVKEDGIIAGLDIFRRVFEVLGDVQVSFNKVDGERVLSGETIGNIKGNARNILMGERTALNLLQKMSGISSLTHKYIHAIAETSAKIVDTRKTTPGLRMLEKYAVTLGGGSNHRFNLSDGVLIKDNHIDAAGGIKEAVDSIRKYASFVRKIEVEVENLEMLKEALEAGADIIMLDNMSVDMLRRAVEYVDNKALLEASGNVNLNTVRDIALTGVNFISVGSITHSAPILDLSMKNLKILSNTFPS
ncbi:MAG: carboxylating nicotinate-nucleotide diphosphorylase [Eubacteriales bacterium]